MKNTVSYPSQVLWIRKGIFALVCMVCCSLAACEPPAPPELDNPPCLSGPIAPQQGATIPRIGGTFRLDFSKLLEPTTLSEDTIYLVRDEMEQGFLANLESTSAVTESRAARLVPLEIKASEVQVNGKPATRLEITPKITLRGDSVYQLVLTRRIRDKLVELSENRRTGSRPLNRCADKTTGVWSGSVDDYKKGFSVILKYNTEPEPPRPGAPRIVEIMASPPSGKAEYVEIQNVHASESLDLCGLLLSDGSSSREIKPFTGTACPKIAPGKLAVILEPDYDIKGNPYKIPSGVVLLTTKGSSTTLLTGGLSSGEPVQLLQGEDLLEQVTPSEVAGGVWPSGKSFEKCDSKGKNDASNWTESADASGGSPGRKNATKCN